MKYQKKGESLVGIILGISILSIAILGIMNLILFANNIIEVYNNITRINVLKDNATNIVKKLDTSSIEENESFYLYKNTVMKQFMIFTGSVATTGYKYIDSSGNIVLDLTGSLDPVYARVLWLQREDTSIAENQNQIIKASVRRLIKKAQYY